MAEDSSAHFACGQILFNLKSSKLNYVLKETPFSAYITIRKKLIKSTEAIHIVEKSDKIVEPKQTGSENIILKQRIKALESEYGLLKIDIEDLEIKNYDLIKQMKKFTKKIRILRNKKLLLRMSRKRKREQVFQIKQVEANKCKEKCDLVDILEATDKNRDEEVLKLMTDLNNIRSMKEF